MTNADMARAYLVQAGEILREAKGLKGRGARNLVVRRSQEVVEPSLKAALRGVGVETLKMPDVGSLLRTHRRKFPDRFRRQIGKLAAISRRLRLERELSFYGEEETQTAPQDLYSRDDAVSYLNEAAYVHAQRRALLTDRPTASR
jgi:HEPN domain-containing protein